MPDTVRTVAVIGAGPSGIAATKALHQRGLDVTTYEARGRAGGLWAVGDDVVQASYPSLECNTSKTTTQFSDFPMPKEWPAYPHNRQMASYFESYIDRFGFRDRIRFGTPVERADRTGAGWVVRTASGATATHDALVVANGHHRVPRWPDPPIPGDFAGRQMHAHDYVGPDGFAGKRVVVVGMGNSAMDIAVELSFVCSVRLAARRGAHIVPKFAFGQPIDRFNTSLPIPWAVKRAFFDLIIRSSIGRPESVGLPKPDHRLGEAHPTVSQRIIDRVRAGAVTPVANIARFEGSIVHLTDGTSVDADAVIYCTGYTPAFPFLDESVVRVVDSRVDLFHHVFAPGVERLAFIGLVQPFGSLIPVAEAQSEWVADELTGRYRRPAPEVMCVQIESERHDRERRFVASPRHTMEIDLHPYLRAIRRERRRGARAAALAVHPSAEGLRAAS
ncbi:MAG: flavin-containing monooxygenase [Candidatus Dormibacteria bacterium]